MKDEEGVAVAILLKFTRTAKLILTQFHNVIYCMFFTLYYHIKMSTAKCCGLFHRLGVFRLIKVAHHIGVLYRDKKN